ncbi:transposase [Mesorhizobium sp. BH1-1-4]|nr:transposase [Mesorhizobium sp. BH1-1-4]
MLDGTVEIDHFHLGEVPESDRVTHLRAGPEGQVKTEKAPVMAMVQRPTNVTLGTPAGDARAAVVIGLSLRPALTCDRNTDRNPRAFDERRVGGTHGYPRCRSAEFC